MVTYLDCFNCPLLTALPALPMVTTLYCSNCPLLAALPDLPMVTYLNCSNCPLLTALPALPMVTTLYCANCPWLIHERNPVGATNTTKLHPLAALRQEHQGSPLCQPHQVPRLQRVLLRARQAGRQVA